MLQEMVDIYKSFMRNICHLIAFRLSELRKRSADCRVMGEGVERLRPYLSGGLAAVVAEMATFPLDTAKTRQQLQGQVGAPGHLGTRWGTGGGRVCGTGASSTPSPGWSGERPVLLLNLLLGLPLAPREEGPRSVYRGLAPALLRQAVYGTIKFGLYYSRSCHLPPATSPWHLALAPGLGTGTWHLALALAPGL